MLFYESYHLHLFNSKHVVEASLNSSGVPKHFSQIFLLQEFESKTLELHLKLKWLISWNLADT